jgi:hypothetical protein
MSLSVLRPAIIVLTLATAAIHLVLSASAGLMFLLNGLGYIALLAAVLGWLPLAFLKGREGLLHYAFMAYTAVTLVAYFVVNGGESFSNVLGLATKVIELVLIVALWQHLRLTVK